MNETKQKPAPQSKWKQRLFSKWGFIAVVLLLAVIAAPWLIGPVSPQRVVIATGRADGAYIRYGEKYKEIFAREGVQLEVRQTAGSVENVQLLQNGEVDFAFMQSGIADENSAPGLQSLCSLYPEPVWLFYRSWLADARGDSIDLWNLNVGQRKRLRIAVGAEGSGTRAAARQLLKESGILSSKQQHNPSLFPLGGQQAADALKNGDIDMAFFVVAPTSPIVGDLLAADGVHLMDFRQAKAYQRRMPFLSSVTLSAGMVDVERNLPPRDVTLLAPTANIVARRDLHPTLVPLMLGACYEIHESGSWLSEPGQFPSARHVSLPLNRSAKRYLESGPSFFYKYLPFWLASWLSRMKFMLLPMITLLLPFLKLAPPVYRWRIRRKIYRWYRVLREVDRGLEDGVVRPHAAGDVARLDQLETELAGVKVPLSYMAEFYTLRLHLDFVREKLQPGAGVKRRVTERQAA